MKSSPWAIHFEQALDRLKRDDFVNRFTTISAKQLQRKPASIAEEILSDHLKDLVCSNSQMISLAKQALEVGLYQAGKRYPSKKAFLQRLNDEDPGFSLDAGGGGGTFNPPVFVTGLAGIGKSVLGRTIVRAAGAPGTTGEHAGYAPLPIHSIVRVQIRHADTRKEILDRVAQSGPLAGTLPQRMEATRKHLYRNGVSLLIVDELQFLTAGGGANKLLVDVLMRLSDLGVKVLVIGNFSLGASIKKRYQQDRHRLLSRPEIIMPDLPDSKDWLGYLGLLNDSIGDIADIRLSNRALDLFTMTFGVKRLLIRLIVIAYGIARCKGKFCISWENIEGAYRSSHYSDNRSDVSDLRQAYVTRKQPNRPDLACPFEMLGERLDDYSAAARLAEQQLINQKITMAAMTETERSAYKDYSSKRAGGGSRKKKRESGADKSPEAQLANLDAFLTEQGLNK